MKTRSCFRWLSWTLVLTMLAASAGWLDAADGKRRSAPQKRQPASEIRRVFDRIGNFFSGAVREIDERDRRHPFDDPFFYPPPPPPPPRGSYPLPGTTGIYPVPPGLEDYFLYRQMNPYPGTQPNRSPSRAEQQRQSMSFAVPNHNSMLPYAQTIGRDYGAAARAAAGSGTGAALGYHPLTPSAAGERPRGLVSSNHVGNITRDDAGMREGSQTTAAAPPSTPDFPVDSSITPLEPEPQKRPVLTNLPMATPVPGRPGLVYPPGADPTPGNMVDVRGFVRGQKVSDPRTGKIFLVP